MSGRVWQFGDDVDTDQLAPGRFMKAPLAELAQHCLATLDADFAAGVRPGDYVVAGRNFGMGSSREQAAQVLKLLGVEAVIASSFAGIFYRNAFNLGLPALTCEYVERLAGGHDIAVDAVAGRIDNLTSGVTFDCAPIPAHLLDLVAAGGLIGYLEQRLGAGR